MNSIAEFVEHPQLSARNRWQTIDSPVGPLRRSCRRWISTASTPSMGAVPALGQHTDDILEELGFDRRR